MTISVAQHVCEFHPLLVLSTLLHTVIWTLFIAIDYKYVTLKKNPFYTDGGSEWSQFFTINEESDYEYSCTCFFLWT